MARYKRKLYIITQEYPYNYNENTFLEPELKRLQDTGLFDITIISTAKKGSKLTASISKDIEVVNVPIESIFKSIKKFCLAIKYGVYYFIDKKISIEHVELRKGDFTFSRLFDSIMLYIQANIFFHDMMQMNIDLSQTIIYTYWCHVQTLAIALHKSELKGVKLISRIHGFDLYESRTPHGRHPFRVTIDDKLDKLFFIAEAGLKYYVNRMDAVPSNKYVLSRLGIECVESYNEIRVQQKEADCFMIVSCSNLIPVKCVEIIIQALNLIENIPIQWIHFGDGDLRDELETLAFRLLDDKPNIKFNFKGKTDNQEILSFYRKHLVGVFITTSSSEGCPVSIQEAMSFGLPIIATAVGEIPFMVRGNGILLSENPTPREVASAIEQMSSASLEKINVMRKKSRDLWEQYFDAEKNYSFFIDKLMEL